jgi:hypothetical protein
LTNNSKAEGPPVSKISNQNLGSASLNCFPFSFGVVKIVFKKIINYSTLGALAYWPTNDKAKERASLISTNTFTKILHKKFHIRATFSKKYFKLLLDILSEMLK